MSTYAITGGLGSGKTLVSVGRIKSYLEQGRRVATNLDIDLSKLLEPSDKNNLVRIKDYPTIEDFECLGRGHYIKDTKNPDLYSKNESKNGLIVLDECAVLFNSREWNDKTRAPVIAWLRHSRKLGWDIIYIMQDVNSVDKQLRAGLIEHEGVCKRADRFSIPFLGSLLRFVGLGFLSRPPRIHICTIKYGLGHLAPVVDRWMYRGSSIQNGYDTNQIFHEFASETFTDKSGNTVSLPNTALHSVLSAYHTKGRYLEPSTLIKIRLWINGTPYKKPVTSVKHLMTQRVMKLPPEQRIAYINRYNFVDCF